MPLLKAIDNINNKVMLATLVQGAPKVPFAIATTPKV